MKENFVEVLRVGGKSNSLGRTDEVIQAVLENKIHLEELYLCVFDQDAWVRMRAIDALEKVCRQHPDWILPYIDRFFGQLHGSDQPSIQWHLAQIYGQIDLTPEQRTIVIEWLKERLCTIDTDWIVSANSMATITHMCKDGYVGLAEVISLLKIQQEHKSNAVKKKATKLIDEIQN